MAGKIAVIGDVILDVYHFCKNRENPESSAPCYTIERTEYKPGGAGNVAANLAKLGSDCTLFSVVGEDEEANKLDRLLKASGVNPSIVRDKKRSTIIKERYLSSTDGRYHFRADFEKKEYINEDNVDEILRRIKDFSLVVVSDYNKGTISRALMDGLKKKGIRIVADTKPCHKDFFKGIFMIKPNVREVREMAGLQDELAAAQKVAQELETNVLLTRGREGISYFGLNGERYDFKPTVPSEKIFDVTGAGDTVMAAFCHFLNKGFPIKECVNLANKAAGISVQYPGCYQVSEEELGIK